MRVYLALLGRAAAKRGMVAPYRGRHRFGKPFNQGVFRNWRFCGTLVIALFATTAACAESFEVQWTDGHLSVAAERAPLADLIAEITRQADVELEGKQNLDGDISAHFSGLPLDEGLKLLLGDRPYVMTEVTDPFATTTKRTLLIAQRSTGRAPTTGGTAATNATSDAQARRADEDAEPSVLIEDWLNTGGLGGSQTGN